MVYNSICLVSSVSVVAILVGGVLLNMYGLGVLRFLMVLALATFMSTGITAMEMLKPRDTNRRCGYLNVYLFGSIVVLVVGIGISHFIISVAKFI
jgi:MFS family permease